MLRSRLIWMAGILFLAQGVLALILGAHASGPLVSDLIEFVLGLLAIGASLLAGRRSGPYGRRAWGFVTAALVIWTVAQGMITYYEGIVRASYQGAWPSDPLVAFWVVPLIMAIFLSSSTGQKRWDVVDILDFAQILILAIAAYVAYLYVPSQWHESGVWMTRLGWGAMNVRDVVLAGALVARAVFSHRKLVRSLFWRVTAFFVLYQFADLLYHYIEEVHNIGTGTPWDLLWSAPFVGLIIAASTWRQTDESELARTPASPSSVARLFSLFSAFLPLPVLFVAVQVEKEIHALAIALVIASLLFSASRLLFTERRRDQSQKIQSALFRIAEKASSCKALEDFCAAIHETLSELMHARNFCVALRDPVTQSVSFPCFRNEAGALETAPNAFERDLAERVLRTGEPLLAVSRPSGELSRGGKAGIFTGQADWLGVPLMEAGIIFGVLVVQCQDQPHHYGEVDKEVLAFVARQLAGFIEQKSNEDALRQSELRFSKTFSANPELASISTLGEGRYVDVNEAFLRALGRSREEVVGKTAGDINFWHDPGQRTRFLKEIESQGRIRDVEVHFCTKSGEVRTGLLSGEIIELRGEQCLLAVTRDITERKRTEEELHHREKELREAQRLAQIGSWEFDAGSDTMRWSDQLFQISHRDPSLAPPKAEDLAQVYSKQSWERLMASVESALAGGPPFRIDMSRVFPGGERKTFVVRGEPVRNENGQVVRVRGTVQDITERKRAEEVIQASEARYRSLVEDSLGLICTHDLDGTILSVNPAAAAAWGGTPEELVGKRLNGFVTLSANQLFGEYLERIEREKSAEGFLEVVTKSGEVRVWAYRNVLREETGQKPYVLGFAYDITEHRRTEDALRKEKAFSDAVIDSIPGAFYVTDPSGRIIRWNKNTEQMLGYTSEEMANADTRNFLVEEDLSVAAAKRQEAFGGGYSMLETALLTKGKKRIPVLLTGMRAVIGDSSYLVGVGIDITDRKRAEEALRESEERFRQMADNSPDMFWLYDLRGEKLLYVSPGYEKIWSRPLEDFYANPAGWTDTFHPEDRERAIKNLEALSSSAGTENEYRIVRPDGSLRWIHTRGFPIRNADGEVCRLGGIAYDITERKQAELSLRQSEASLAEAQRIGHMGSWDWNLLTNEEWWSDELFRIYGVERGDETTTLGTFLNLVHPEDRQVIHRAGEEAMETGLPMQAGFRLIRPDGVVRHMQTRAEVVRDDLGIAVRMVGTTQDITERKQAEEALRASQEMFYKAFYSSPEPICIITLSEGKFLDVNKAFCDQLGYTRDEVLGRTGPQLGLEPLSGLSAGQLQLIEQGGLHNLELVLPTRSGELRTALISFETVEMMGQPCILAQGRDVTESRRAEDALRASEQRYRDFISHSTEGVWRMEVEKPIPLDLPPEEALERVVHTAYLAECNGAMARMQGFANPDVILGKKLRNFPIASQEPWLDSIRSAIAGGWQNRTVELSLTDQHGNSRYVQRTEVPIIENGLLVRVWGLTRDVTEIRRTEEALRTSEESYRLLFERNLAGVVRATLDGHVLECNEALARILGFQSRREVLEANVKDFYLEKNDGTPLVELLKAQRVVIGEEFHARRKDGTPAWVLASASLLEDEEGSSTFLATAFDITHWKELGEQLRQSQKMEAVGRLAGGVAHDFNNMLQIINGYSELVIDQLPAEDPVQAHIQEIKSIVERAAGLTRQLLAFSRQQVLAPQVLDLNQAIANLSKMLRRLIGEDVQLSIVEGRPLGRVKADPGQIDQVILNLAVNARDAMPRGGKLTIETSNVDVDESYALSHFPMSPGPYVMISVSDTGHGMDARTQTQVFEPFFTTKEKGKGTGLGLATVYGIIKQSGGFIWVESDKGKGATFHIFLPPVAEAPASRKVRLEPARMKGTETVLLVEDDRYVRSLVRRSLQSKGYTVLEARSGEDALRVAQKHRGLINLLITDVVMPGMSGRELAEALTPLRPGMKTLYMSGYADDAILHHGVLDSGGALLQKPFSAEALARKVREVLEGS